MLKPHTVRDTINPAFGQPRVVRVSLCSAHDYLTFSGECSCDCPLTVYDRYAVVGTTYGWLHNSAGDKRLWQSESGARHAMRRYLA